MELQDRILQKLDEISENVVQMRIESAKQSKDIAKNTKDLEIHIEGTRANTRYIRDLEKKINLLEEKMSTPYLIKRASVILGTGFSLLIALYQVIKILKDLI